MRIDSKTKKLDVLVNKNELNKRKKKWIQPSRAHLSGALYKYSILVSSASEGAVTDRLKK